MTPLRNGENACSETVVERILPEQFSMAPMMNKVALSHEGDCHSVLISQQAVRLKISSCSAKLLTKLTKLHLVLGSINIHVDPLILSGTTETLLAMSTLDIHERFKHTLLASMALNSSVIEQADLGHQLHKRATTVQDLQSSKGLLPRFSLPTGLLIVQATEKSRSY